jgi:uncharacterized membrane-anchored protein YhcB (DUF1043 family)
MNNQEITQYLLSLESKVGLLLNRFQKLKIEHEQLQIEHLSLQSELEEKKKELDNFQNQSKIAKLVDGISVDTRDTAELKKVISDYIKELDLCIAHLSE